jgi:hypothetical protein
VEIQIDPLPQNAVSRGGKNYDRRFASKHRHRLK